MNSDKEGKGKVVNDIGFKEDKKLLKTPTKTDERNEKIDDYKQILNVNININKHQTKEGKGKGPNRGGNGDTKVKVLDDTQIKNVIEQIEHINQEQENLEKYQKDKENQGWDLKF
jgi:hypothetical protein